VDNSTEGLGTSLLDSTSRPGDGITAEHRAHQLDGHPGHLAPVRDDATPGVQQLVVPRRAVPAVRDRARALSFLSDLAGVVLAALTTALLATEASSSLVLPVSLAATLSLISLAASYRREELLIDRSVADDFPGLMRAVTLGTWLACATLILFGETARTAPLIGFWAAAVLMVSLSRTFGRALSRRYAWQVNDVIVVGAGNVGRLVVDKYRKHPEYGARVLGYVDADPITATAGSRSDVPVLGSLNELEDIVQGYGVKRVVVAFSRDSPAEMLDALRVVRRLAVQVDIVPRLFEVVGPQAIVQQLEGLAVVSVPPARLSSRALLVKRALDVSIAGIGLVALTPLMIAIALAIRLDSPGSLLFRGMRVGRGGRPVGLLKFRTMHSDAERLLEVVLADAATREEYRLTHKLAKDPRVTRVGRVLRRTSLDELPQLFNVLRGDLSLVGPRPMTLFEWNNRFGAESPYHGQVPPGYWTSDAFRPGLTGYWQINGRSTNGFDERLRLDMAYLSNWSLALDASILAKTVRAVVSAQGAY
jgi:exopolysaccharide biosynthesis polyprenyl glycosylphosphotransferase